VRRIWLATALALAVALAAVIGSAAQLAVDGGTLQVFTFSVGLGPIAATVDIDPDTLNPKSQGNHVMAYVELPDGYDVADIDVSTIILRVAGVVGPDCSEPSGNFVSAKLTPTELGDHDGDGIADLMVKFSRPDVLLLIIGKADDGLVTLVVSGELLPGGTRFEGCDTIDPPEPATSAPMPAPEPILAATPQPTPELTPSPTPEPTATPEPEQTVEPEPSPEPTATPEPEPAVEPESSPEPTATPEPEPTAEPEPFPEPTSTPEPTPTPTP
jgi:hypothetical protein